MTKEEYMEKRLRYLLESERSEEDAYKKFDKEFSSEVRKKLAPERKELRISHGVPVKKVGKKMPSKREPPYKGRKA